MDIAIDKNDAVRPLWNAYKKTLEYKSGQTKAIPKHHLIVENREEWGLQHVYYSFVRPIGKILEERDVTDWLYDWQGMHRKLFKEILVKCGEWRKKELYIGDQYDDVLKLSEPWNVPRKIEVLAKNMPELLKRDHTNLNDICYILAEFHYKFIIIHPFDDGNGRIARAITDQLALYYGLPPAMGGYPKHDSKEQKRYHEAIYNCGATKEYDQLAQWIKSYVENQIEHLA